MPDLRVADDSTLRDSFLFGLLQGFGLWYAFRNDLALPVAIAIGAKITIEYIIAQDQMQLAMSIFITIIGFIASEFLSNTYDQPKEDRRSSSKKHSSSRHANGATRRARRTISDITSVDSNSELIGPRASMTPLEREIAALRARASLADSERRRFKEERKWAIAQGNLPLAEQMKWQVKKYKALMQSFHREADEKLQRKASRATRLPPIREHSPPATAAAQPRQTRPTAARATKHPTVSVDITPSQLKSAIRVNVR